MTRIANNQLNDMGSFARGVNNVAAETDLRPDEVREAVNVDIGPKGGMARRRGSTLVAAGDCHSLFPAADYLLLVKDGVLTATLGASDTDYPVRADMTALPVSYAQVGEDVYWSDARVIRRVTPDFQDLPVWLDTPLTPSISAAAGGGMQAGTYQVTVTMVDAAGVESGAPLGAVIELSEGQGIQVSELVLAPGAAVARIYVTEPNGMEYYDRVETMSASVAVTASMIAGAELETQFMYPLPAGQIVRLWNGYVLVASGDTLYFSEVLRTGLHRPDNYYRFAGLITMVQPVGDGEDSAGVYVSDGKRVYFLSGRDPDTWAKQIRFLHPAVEGSGMEVSGSLFFDETEQPYTGPVAFWLAKNGVYCLGLPGGAVRTIKEDSVALPSYERAAMLLREENGTRQIIGSFSGEKANAYAVTDTMSATVRRHGVTL